MVRAKAAAQNILRESEEENARTATYNDEGSSAGQWTVYSGL
jgi:ribosomal silencing factor RsfS